LHDELFVVETAQKMATGDARTVAGPASPVRFGCFFESEKQGKGTKAF
jgi:hypothetical protein